MYSVCMGNRSDDFDMDWVGISSPEILAHGLSNSCIAEPIFDYIDTYSQGGAGGK